VYCFGREREKRLGDTKMIGHTLRLQRRHFIRQCTSFLSKESPTVLSPIHHKIHPRDNNDIFISSSSIVIRRTLARSSNHSAETPEDKAITFVVSVGHERRVAEGVVNALKESGMSGEMLLSMVRSMAGRWEVGEDEGLDALVASVKQTLDLSEGKKVVTFYVVPPNAWASSQEDAIDEEHDVMHDETEEEKKKMRTRAFVVEAVEGTSIADVAKFGAGEGASTLRDYVECACSGIMACSTCHVVIDPEWFDVVGGPIEAEEDMLDLAYAPRSTSRLGCQVVLTKDHDGMVIRLPKGANNMMDFIPFED